MFAKILKFRELLKFTQITSVTKQHHLPTHNIKHAAIAILITRFYIHKEKIKLT